MTVRWRSELPQWVLLGAMFLLAAVVWSSTPERVPIHWDITGAVDRYAGKVEGLLLIPALSLGVYLLLLFIPRIDPGRANYAGFAGPYAAIRLAIVAVLAVSYALVVLAALGRQPPVIAAVPILIGALLVVLGNYMGKIRPNWFVGVRTPWTLSSKRSWTQTHRLAGWLFVASGIAFVLAGAFSSPLALGVAVGVLTLSVVSIVVYSYLVWRTDPDRVPPANTAPADEA